MAKVKTLRQLKAALRDRKAQLARLFEIASRVVQDAQDEMTEVDDGLDLEANLITFENAADELRSINGEADEIASMIESLVTRIERHERAKRKAKKGSKS